MGATAVICCALAVHDPYNHAYPSGMSAQGRAVRTSPASLILDVSIRGRKKGDKESKWNLRLRKGRGEMTKESYCNLYVNPPTTIPAFFTLRRYHCARTTTASTRKLLRIKTRFSNQNPLESSKRTSWLHATTMLAPAASRSSCSSRKLRRHARTSSWWTAKT